MVPRPKCMVIIETDPNLVSLWSWWNCLVDENGLLQRRWEEFGPVRNQVVMSSDLVQEVGEALHASGHL